MTDERDELEVTLDIPSDSRFFGVVRATIATSLSAAIDAADKNELAAAIGEACAIARYLGPEAERFGIVMRMGDSEVKVYLTCAASGCRDEACGQEHEFAQLILDSLVDAYDIQCSDESVRIGLRKEMRAS